MSVRKEFCEPRLTPISPRISHVLKGDGRLDLAQAPRHGHPTLGTEKSASSGDAADQVTMALTGAIAQGSQLSQGYRYRCGTSHSHSSHTLVLGGIVKISRQKMVTSLYNSQASKQATFHLNDGIAAIEYLRKAFDANSGDGGDHAALQSTPLLPNSAHLLGARLARLQTRTIDALTGVLGCACLGTCVFRLTSLLANCLLARARAHSR